MKDLVVMYVKNETEFKKAQKILAKKLEENNLDFRWASDDKVDQFSPYSQQEDELEEVVDSEKPINFALRRGEFSGRWLFGFDSTPTEEINKIFEQEGLSLVDMTSSLNTRIDNFIEEIKHIDPNEDNPFETFMRQMFEQ